MTFVTQRGYPLTSLAQDLRRVTTIGCPDALAGSERGDTIVLWVPLVMTYHPCNTYIKRYLLQNFGILSMHRPANARHLSTATAPTSLPSTEQPGSHACQRPRCQTCQFITPLTDIRGPKSTIRDHFTCMSENLVCCISCPDAPISTPVKLEEVSGV